MFHCESGYKIIINQSYDSLFVSITNRDTRQVTCDTIPPFGNKQIKYGSSKNPYVDILFANLVSSDRYVKMDSKYDIVDKGLNCHNVVEIVDSLYSMNYYCHNSLSGLCSEQRKIILNIRPKSYEIEILWQPDSDYHQIVQNISDSLDTCQTVLETGPNVLDGYHELCDYIIQYIASSHEPINEIQFQTQNIYQIDELLKSPTRCENNIQLEAQEIYKVDESQKSPTSENQIQFEALKIYQIDELLKSPTSEHRILFEPQLISEQDGKTDIMESITSPNHIFYECQQIINLSDFEIIN